MEVCAISPARAMNELLSNGGQHSANGVPPSTVLQTFFSECGRHAKRKWPRRSILCRPICDVRTRSLPSGDVYAGVTHWKQRRKPPLTSAEIADAIRNLNVLGWLTSRRVLTYPYLTPS